MIYDTIGEKAEAFRVDNLFVESYISFAGRRISRTLFRWRFHGDSWSADWIRCASRGNHFMMSRRRSASTSHESFSSSNVQKRARNLSSFLATRIDARRIVWKKVVSEKENERWDISVFPRVFAISRIFSFSLFHGSVQILACFLR